MSNLKQHIKETLILAIPISIGQLGHIMMGVVDSVMVGHVGAAQLAASSLVNGFYFLIVVLGIGMTSAITPLVSIALGAGKKSECGVILNQGFIVNFIFSVIILTVLYFASGLIEYLNQPEEVTVLSISYLRILAFSSIPFLVFQVYRQFCEGVSVVIPPMIIALMANLANVFFNWVWIYGKLGFEPMGLDGAGYSTLFTRSLMALAMVVFVFKTKKFSEYHIHFRMKEVTPIIIKKLIAIGIPSGFQYFLEVGSFAFAAVMIGWIGSVPLAAHQIALNLASVTYMVVLGITSAGTIRVSNAFGNKNIQRVKEAGFTTLLLAGTLMGTSGLFFIITRNFLPTLYIDNEIVIGIASNLIIIAALFQIFDGLQAAGIAVLRGLTDVKIPMFISLFSYWGISIPVAALLGFAFDLGAIGIWIGLSVGLALVAFITIYRFTKISHRLYDDA
ncbi:MAG: MATE family efflux transporter [Bacteroidetes bacterium]|nr:MATE family efflux transporter [Bacteroidota bacterium]